PPDDSRRECHQPAQGEDEGVWPAPGRGPRRCPGEVRGGGSGMNLYRRIDREVKGWLSNKNGRWLASLASEVPEHQAIVQVGVYHGRSCFYMAVEAKATVYGIDPWDLPGERKTSKGEPFTDPEHRLAAYRHRENLGLEDGVEFIRGFS